MLAHGCCEDVLIKARQWKNVKFDPAVPKTPEQTVTKICVITVSYRNLYHCIKFHNDFSTHFCPTYAKIYAQVTRLDFWVLATP